MLVSHRKRFIYTKTMKTAGTSVESYFEPYCLPEGQWEFGESHEEYVGESGIVGYRGNSTRRFRFYNHMPARRVKRLLGDEVWHGYFKFCVIRDPFDKVVSAFHFYEHLARTTGGRRWFRFNLQQWWVRNRSPVDRFRHWVARGGYINDRDVYTLDGKFCVDFFIRFEALAEGIRAICEKLEIPFDPDRLPHLKGSTRPREYDLSEYYDGPTAAAIQRRYALELDHFGYRPPKPAQNVHL